ncbi:hypothetical protein E2C01_006930 [Portunus trituberculatus]|uniref:Uncharacterized protein n=1 Tax=Portunus trituberculatus TaxID=210409 RepID=A0A5B7CWR1_PORTR|nr:hypothetical protein [Portunus trituberculatus]
MSNAAALELLKAQAALLPLDDSSTLVTSAVAHGQTLHLTEAGRQALKLIKQELPLFPTSTLPKEKNQEEESTASEKTDGGSGPVILQVLPSDGTEEAICEANINTSPSPCKRQKIMQLVTKFHGSSDQQLIMAKISGKE